MAKRMPSQLQRRTAKNLVFYYADIRFEYLKDLLADAGYSLSNSEKNSKAIIMSPGVQNALVELGFNENTAKAMVGEILLNGNEQNRLRAAELVFKVFGTYAPEKSLIANLDINKLTETIRQLAEKK